MSWIKQWKREWEINEVSYSNVLSDDSKGPIVSGDQTTSHTVKKNYMVPGWIILR